MSSANEVRVRFAPSPTGPLHIGGVRTALYNYLFAKKMGGTFILRIEDTDQTRYVEGAEQYIKDSLDWLGLTPDEGPGYGGDHGPYRQSERKDLYAKYAHELVEKGHAYYAFDTPEELEAMRESQKALGHHSPKYDHRTRKLMRNSLTLDTAEVQQLLDQANNVIIRLKMPEDENVSFVDIVREEVSFNTGELDDKVILKADGMPTYHLANIVDDHLMEISHVIRGEEWLSSTAHHVMMYRFFGWEAPKFTHLPLILKPTGKGKLSKRDGAKFGFPVFPMEWQDAEDTWAGFKEDGYDKEALLNFLVLLGWNPGNDQEMMSLQEMIDFFSLEKIVKAGARFDVDKSLWFNQQYIIAADLDKLTEDLKPFLPAGILDQYDDAFLKSVVGMMQERITRYKDFYSQAEFFFVSPTAYDEKQVKKRLKPGVPEELLKLKDIILSHMDNDTEAFTQSTKQYLNDNELKMGIYLPLTRIMITGGLKGPDLFETMHLLGIEEVSNRWDNAMEAFAQLA